MRQARANSWCVFTNRLMSKRRATHFVRLTRERGRTGRGGLLDSTLP